MFFGFLPLPPSPARESGCLLGWRLLPPARPPTHDGQQGCVAFKPYIHFGSSLPTEYKEYVTSLHFRSVYAKSLDTFSSKSSPGILSAACVRKTLLAPILKISSSYSRYGRSERVEAYFFAALAATSSPAPVRSTAAPPRGQRVLQKKYASTLSLLPYLE